MSRPASVSPLTPERATNITKPVIEGLKEIVFGSPSIFERDEFTAAPPTGNPLTDTVRALTQYNCRRWARSDKSQYSDSVNTANSNICGLYLGGLGENPEPGQIGAPFDGGQCQGTVYQCLITAESQNSVFTVNSNFKTIGPVTGMRTTVEGTRYKGFVTSRGAITASSCGIAAGSLLPLAEREVFDVVNRDYPPGATSITGICSGPDNCGQPPPTIQPPSQIVGGTPPPPVAPIDIPGFGPTDVTVGPGPDGGIEVCFVELNLCVTVTDGDDGGPDEPGEPEPMPSTGPNENGPGDGMAVGGPGPENDDGDFGVPPEGRAYVGAFVEFTVPERLGNIPSANPSNPAYATVVGNVCLDHNGVFSDAKQARSKWVSCFRENPNLTVRGVRVNTRPGVSFRVYPVSVETCPENTCPVPEQMNDG